MNKKYSNFLTILLVVIIIAILVIIGVLGYKYYKTYVTKNSSQDFVDNFVDSSTDGQKNNKNNDSTNDIQYDGIDEGEKTETDTSTGKKKQYNGFDVAGTIEIPATGLKCPILEQYTYSPKALETSVVVLYGVGLNQPGNTTIAGHNYRNGLFFSNNKKLNIGDKIYITDSSGRRVAYTIYNKYEADENESDYITRDTQGVTEISLTTCTDDSKARIIILAKADI
ncbi:lPXTG-site transpeptidase (Sortase) family protein [Clostridium sp. CAG:356]|jgi:LPXTG-site transpeptidase (sortase) family protein|nr:MAG: hypothetical protein BHW02_01435 [Clostridium sp. 28_12]CDD37796.1 lPXTG-site transpeptidase (Sortase) family protein [Clostridium sp. CAG:356]